MRKEQEIQQIHNCEYILKWSHVNYVNFSSLRFEQKQHDFISLPHSWVILLTYQPTLIVKEQQSFQPGSQDHTRKLKVFFFCLFFFFFFLLFVKQTSQNWLTAKSFKNLRFSYKLSFREQFWSLLNLGINRNLTNRLYLEHCGIFFDLPLLFANSNLSLHGTSP